MAHQLGRSSSSARPSRRNRHVDTPTSPADTTSRASGSRPAPTRSPAAARPTATRSSASSRAARRPSPTMPSPPPGPRSPAGGGPAASTGPSASTASPGSSTARPTTWPRLMALECGKTLAECRAEVIEGLHMVQYVFGTGRMPVGDHRRFRDRREGRLRPPQAEGRRRGHHAVELPVRRPALDARAVAARREHGRLQAVARTRPRSASGWSSCSSRPASRPGRSTSSTARGRSARRWCATRT